MRLTRAATPRGVSSPQHRARLGAAAGHDGSGTEGSVPNGSAGGRVGGEWLGDGSVDGINGSGAVSGAGLGSGTGQGAGAGEGGSPWRPLGSTRDWAELLRISALFTVPGDALAGAAAIGARPNRNTLAAIGASLCLYEAGMALNDWADRDEDAVERPHRPLPSGRIPPGAALAAAGVLTAAGLGLAARAGRPALTLAGLLAGTVWAYDVKLKHTPAGPAAMATARGLDLLLGATATGSGTRAVSGTSAPSGSGSGGVSGPGTGGDSGWRTAAGLGSVRPALPASAVLAAHTLAVTAVSRREAEGGSSATPLAALVAVGVLARFVVSDWGAGAGGGAARLPGSLRPPVAGGVRVSPHQVLGVAYAATAARPLLHAALNPSPQLTQRAVGGGIRAMIPLQAALAARAGSLGTALAAAALAPLARRLGRRVSVT